jgi:transposase
MMGRLNHDQRQLFYSFCLEEVVPDDHLVREIAAVLDLSWLYAELAPYYPKIGRPSIDPALMIRMLIIGYVFAIRSERALCRDVQVNLAYRWFCGLSIEDQVPDHSAFSRARNERFRESEFARALRIPLSTFRMAPKFLLAAPDRPRNRATRGRIREFGLETGLRNPITGASDIAQPAAF